jgi:hypothetical protein
MEWPHACMWFLLSTSIAVTSRRVYWYKKLQYPGMTVGRVLKLRGELTGAPALFWADRRPAEELYDIVDDPEEVNNLAGSTTHAKILSQLHSELDRWIERVDDKGRFSESDVEATAESSDRWFQSAMRKRGLSPQVDPESYLKWWKKELGRIVTATLFWSFVRGYARKVDSIRLSLTLFRPFPQ